METKNKIRTWFFIFFLLVPILFSCSKRTEYNSVNLETKSIDVSTLNFSAGKLVRKPENETEVFSLVNKTLNSNQWNGKFYPNKLMLKSEITPTGTTVGPRYANDDTYLFGKTATISWDVSKVNLLAEFENITNNGSYNLCNSSIYSFNLNSTSTDKQLLNGLAAKNFNILANQLIISNRTGPDLQGLYSFNLSTRPNSPYYVNGSTITLKYGKKGNFSSLFENSIALAGVFTAAPTTNVAVITALKNKHTLFNNKYPSISTYIECTGSGQDWTIKITSSPDYENYSLPVSMTIYNGGGHLTHYWANVNYNLDTTADDLSDKVTINTTKINDNLYLKIHVSFLTLHAYTIKNTGAVSHLESVWNSANPIQGLTGKTLTLSHNYDEKWIYNAAAVFGEGSYLSYYSDASYGNNKEIYRYDLYGVTSRNAKPNKGGSYATPFSLPVACSFNGFTVAEIGTGYLWNASDFVFNKIDNSNYNIVFGDQANRGIRTMTAYFYPGGNVTKDGGGSWPSPRLVYKTGPTGSHTFGVTQSEEY